MAVISQVTMKQRFNTFVGMMRGRHNTCQTQKQDGSFVDKINYKSQATAERVALRMAEKYGRPFDAYQCWFCGGWHIGNAANLTFLKFCSILIVWIIGKKRTGLKDRPWLKGENEERS